jgi:hypothetical protein
MRRVAAPVVVCLAIALSAAGVVAARPTGLERRAPELRWVAPAVDVAELLEEDAAAEGELERPRRIGFPMKTDLDTENSGVWEELPGGGQLWRLEVNSKSALWIVVGFSTFRLQQGGELRVFDPERRRIHGPFTSADIRSHGQLWFPPIEGDTAVVELVWPEELRGVKPKLDLGTVSHGYKSWAFPIAEDDPAAGVSLGSGGCNNDVNCPLGDDWQDQKRSVVLLLVGGSGECSASLINNTSNDCTPYMITAAHCGLNPASITFLFNYERPGCNSGSAPVTDTVTGSTLVANYTSSDVTLLLLDTPPPDDFNVFFNGWDRSGAQPQESWGIHHPSGDVKKISWNADPLINGISPQGWGPNHWRVTNWEDGTTEPVSSGSPLFDQNQRFVGQLHGGTASCSSQTWDEYGKVSASWTGGGTPNSRLVDWLDPGSTGVNTLDGIDATFCQTPQPRLSLQGSTLVDNGDGDGVVEPGETVEITPTLENGGNLTASNVTGTLSTATPQVSIGGGGALNWPNLPAGGTAAALAAATVVLDSGFPCGDEIDFTLDTAADEAPGNWSTGFTLGTGTPAIQSLYEDDMEAGANGWSSVELSGLTNPWSQTTADSDSPATSWFVPDLAGVSSSALVMPESSSLPADQGLVFSHRMNSEAGFDGGVLEYTTNGSTWLDAGDLIVDGGYNTTISLQYNSPIAGRQAWSGDLGGWQTVRVDLSLLATADLSFRFRFASDESLADEGWYVDDVRIESTTYDCGVLAAPGEVTAVGLAKQGARLTLDWSAPSDGGPVVDYVLYTTSLGSVGSPMSCYGGLGASTSLTLSDVPDNSAFVIVGRNATGEGPYGNDSAGAPRPPAPSICP